jgi:hypothetical protein
MLNRIGAHLMRARARTEGSISASEVSASLRDANIAARDLRVFADSHPETAIKLWMWVAMAFRRSGRPFDALAFLMRVERSCCEQNQVAALRMAALKGDVLFDLAAYSAAARSYSRWLSGADEPSLCGRDRSLSNVADLRHRGFDINGSPVERGSTGPCVTGSEWEPYVGLPK